MSLSVILPLLITVSVLYGVVSESCDKNAYLPKGLACKLDIFIRSEGASDTNVTKPSGSSFLIVNGIDYSRKSKGINVAIFDQDTGLHVTGGVFDVSSASSEGTKLKTFLEGLPNDVIVLLAVQSTGNANSHLSAADAVLKQLGLNDTALLDKESLAAVLCKGPGQNCQAKLSKNAVGKGPSFATVTIATKYAYVPDASLRDPYFNVLSKSSGGHCTGASSNADTCGKTIDESTSTEWLSNNQGIGAWMKITFPFTKIDKIRIFQRISSSAQIKDIRIDFSDCTTVHVTLKKDKNSFEEFPFSPRLASWIKLTVSSTYSSSSSVGFKEIEVYYSNYNSDVICDYTTIVRGSTSLAYPLATSKISLRIKSKDALIIISPNSSATGPRYEIKFDQSSTNTTTIGKSNDGSTVTILAESNKQTPVISETTHGSVWIEWTEGRIAVGAGDRFLLYYNDETALTPMFLFLKSPTIDGEFRICGRPGEDDAEVSSPMDREVLAYFSGVSVDEYGFDNQERPKNHGSFDTHTVEGNGKGFSHIGHQFDGTSKWLELGDFKGHCISNPDVCHDGLTVLLRVKRLGSGERFIMSTKAENGLGFAISHFGITGTIRFEVRSSDTRWLIDVPDIGSGLQKLGFTWERSQGLKVVIIDTSGSVTFGEDVNGEDMNDYPDDTSTRLVVGKLSEASTKFFQGTIDGLAIFAEWKFIDWIANYLKDCELCIGHELDGTCYSDAPLDPGSYKYPGLDPSSVSPNECQRRCAKEYSSYALIAAGDLCTCVNTTSSFGSVDKTKCDSSCTGNKQRNCGGVDYMQVASASWPAPSLACTVPAKQEALVKSEVRITATVQFYDPYQYLIPIGNGFLNVKDSSSFSNIFLTTENHTVSPEAILKNKQTGKPLILQCPNSVTSYLTTKNLSLVCPSFVPVNKQFTCDITYDQAASESVTVVWRPGTSLSFSLPDSMIVQWGPQNDERATSSSGSGMYIIPKRLNTKGKLLGVVIHATKTGFFQIKCLSVLCSQSNQYCSSQKACISQSTQCNKEKTCHASNTFRVNSGDCAAPGSSPTLSSQAASNFDYKVEFTLLVWANSGKRVLVAMNTSIDTSSCLYIGVHFPESNPAVLTMSNCSQCALHYTAAIVNAANASNNVLVGMKSPQPANGPTVKNEYPNIKLVLLPKGKLKVEANYSTEGVKPVTFTSSSGTTVNTKIYIQNVLTNITVSSLTCAHPTHRNSNVSLVPHTATNVTYKWMFPDLNVTTYTPWTMYSCTKVGSSQVTMYATNQASLSFTVCEIECQDDIDGLEFAENGLKTTATGKFAQVNFLLRNGSNVKIIIDPGDGSGLRYLNNTKVSGALLVVSLNKSYTPKGVYQVNVTACNNIGCHSCKSVQGNITVQDEIANLTLKAPKCLATNSSGNFTSSISRGCDVNYSWMTNGNQTFQTNEQSWFSHSFAKSGTYTMLLTAHNNVSTAMMQCSGILVKDAITGVGVGLVKPSGIPQNAIIPYNIDGGTDVNVSICFGDGVCMDKNGTVSAEGPAVYNDSFTHNYTKSGDYEANVTFCNCVGCNSTLVSVHVEVPVTGPKVVVGRYSRPTINSDVCSRPLYVKVNETVYMAVGLINGTNVKVLWDYGDNSNSTEYIDGVFHKLGVHSNHSYFKAGNYTIKAKLENQNGHKLFSCHIVAQDPCVGLTLTSNTPRGIPDGSVTFTAITTGARPSDPMSCVAEFDDSQTMQSLPMPWTHPHQNLSFQHVYKNRGKYLVTANCSNAISFCSASTTVELQDKVSGSKVESYGTAGKAKKSWITYEGYHGPGLKGDYFPLDYAIIIEHTSVKGSNLTCSYCFDCNGPEQKIAKSSCGNITHKFNQPGIKNVAITTWNDVSIETVSKNVKIEESIQCEPTEGVPQVKGSPSNITVTTKKYGPNWCCLLKYGIPTKAAFLVPNSANSRCTKLGLDVTTVKPVTKLPAEGKDIFNVTFTFPDVGEYNNVLQCWSRVSECQREFKSVVVHKPCNQPIVTIPDLLPCNSSHHTSSMRSIERVLRTKNTINCEASKNRVFKWEFYHIDPITKKETLLNLTNRVKTDLEFVRIPPRTLAVGMYKICFSLNMTNLSGIFSEHCCRNSITKSPIITTIAGGSEVVVGWNKTKSLDASNTYDPDTSYKTAKESKVKCHWFCKSQYDKNYTFPTSINLKDLPPIANLTREANNTSNTTIHSGCFGNGPGRLEFTECKRDILTGNMQENTTYHFKMFACHEDERCTSTSQSWNIKLGDPPLMAIKCGLNCKDKLNPSEKTSLSCVCTDCSSNMVVFYEWRIHVKKSEKNGDWIELSKPKLDQYLATPHDRRNLVVRKNSLEGGKMYKFVCNGWRWRKGGSSGLSTYQKIANEKPSGGNCTIGPKVGFELDTSFTVSCSDWKDPDTPLTYTYGTVPACDRTDKVTILAPDQREDKYQINSLSSGTKANNYERYISVQVSDSLNAMSLLICIPVQVKAKEIKTEQLETMLSDTVGNLVNSGDTNQANQLLTALVSKLNVNSATDSSGGSGGSDDGGGSSPTAATTQSPEEIQKATEMRTAMAETLTKIKPATIAEASQTAGTLQGIFEGPPEQVSPKAQEAAATVINNVVDMVANQADSGEGKGLDDACSNIFAALGASIDVDAKKSSKPLESPTFSTASKQSKVDDEDTKKTGINSEEIEQKRKNNAIMNKALDTISLVLIKKILPGEEPKILENKYAKAQLGSHSPSDLINKTTTMGKLNVEVPNILAGNDTGGGDEPPPVGSKIINTANMFNYVLSATLTRGGNVFGIEYLSPSENKPTEIHGLKKPIEINIPRERNDIVPKIHRMEDDKIRIHKTEITNNDSTLHINVYPESCCHGFEVFLKKGAWPSEKDYDNKFYLPSKWNSERNEWANKCVKKDDKGISGDDQSGSGTGSGDYINNEDICEEGWGSIDMSTNCTKNSNASKAFEIFISNKDFNNSAMGFYFIGIKPKARNGSKIADCLPANYTLVLYTSLCLYWNENNETWQSDGCETGPKTTPEVTQCFCDHLTSFSSSCIMPPNTIDWDKVKNFDLSQGYVCLSTVLGVFLLYFICLIPARRADRRDAEKTGVTPLPDNDPRDNYCYEIHVHTGFMRGAGTSAEVSIVLNGSVGDSDPRVIKDPQRKTFRTGGVDAFLMTAPQSLGTLRNVRLWHNNGGAYPSWNLLRVMIQDLQTEQRWWFVCDEWLAVDEGDGKIERILYPATSNELTKFNVLFATEIRKNLTDGHLWFSVVTRPSRSTFTRVQRLTCCLSILLTSMLANMMFYKTDSEKAQQPSQGPKGSIQIAGFSFSIQQVSIGVISSLVVFPANLIIVQLFRKARPKEITTSVNKYEEETTLEKNEADLEQGAEKKPVKKEGLPHWCVYIAYAIAFISCVVAGVFVIFYGVTFGAEKSAQWLLSMTVSLVQDVLISQPIKIFLLASIFALLIKDPNKAECEPITDANKLSTDEEWLHKNIKDLNDNDKTEFKKLIMDRPPDEAKLEIARQLRMKEKQMKSIIRELVWYMIFLLIILTISYGNRDPYTYKVTKHVNDLFVRSRYGVNRTFDKVTNINHFWEWMNYTVIPNLYKDKWYNKRDEYPRGFLPDTPTDYVLAVLRLRQLRIQKNSCTYLDLLKHIIPECNDFYDKSEQERSSYLPGWKIPPTVNTTLHPPTAKKTAWEYQTGSELKTFPYWGYKATYDAGGYAKELPTNLEASRSKAYGIVENLRALKWIDQYTRAIFTELAIYNANTNFFCVVTLLYEQLPTGGLFNYPSILTLKLYRYVGGDMYFVMACEIIYMAFTLYFVFRELKKVKNDGIEAIKNVWSATEIFVTCLSLSLVVLYFLRMKFTSVAIDQMRSDYSKFVSFNYTAFLDEWINALMGLIVFLSFLKIIRLLRFNRRMSLLAQTLKVCIPKIAAFLVIYGVAFFAYSLFGCLVFGQSMQGFGTVPRSATTLMDTILGKFALKEMSDANRIIGPLFFYFYTLTMVFILINMFLSIINDSFAEVKSDVNKQSNDYEIVDFMVHRLKENIGKTMGNAIVPIYKEPKTKLEKDFDSIQENADNIMHHMRNLTYENIRHTRWFDADASKKKKKKMFEILMEVDWDYFEDELGDSIPVFEDFLAKYDDEMLQKVHQSYRFQKLRDQEMESKMSHFESDSKESDGSSDSSSDNQSNDGESGDDDEIDNELLEVPPQYNSEASSQLLSPGHSIRSMYGLPQRPSSGLNSKLTSPTLSQRSRLRTRPASSINPAPSLETDYNMSQIIDDIERERCATDAELASFLSEITAVDDNNTPKYESDPEQTAQKPQKKKKKTKKSKKHSEEPGDSVAIKSKPAWGEDDVLSRKSPEGSSEKDRMIQDGAEGKMDEGLDNDAFEDDIPLQKKFKDRKKKKKKRKESDV